MASTVPDYEYDIFISYRHNDNLDSWVSAFVQNLEKELKGTIKESVSIYFDTNPHDGLLETHNVDKSLEGKLKCLIFIPVISQTYCDPRSFAWQHEFTAFNKMAKEDQFGRDIKLSTGNVTSRILPVKIHDLDQEDKTLLENEMEGFIRGIEFIYKEPGVNRPLKPEDDEKKNLNNTIYRNQINKVANSVKDIISAIKKHNQKDSEIPKELIIAKPEKQKSLIPKIAIVSAIAMATILLGFFTIPKLLTPPSKDEKSIAVLPFKLLTNEPDKQYLADGMMDAILLHLQKFKDLRVMSRTSVEQYQGTTKTTRIIGQELGVEYLLEGSFQKVGDNVRLIVQLIKANEESHEWANEYNRNWKDIFPVQSEVAEAIAKELKVVITPGEKQLLDKTPTANMAAYEAYLQGKFYLRKFTQNNLDLSLKYFEQAKEIDPDYALAYAGICYVWFERQQMGFTLPAEAIPKSMAALTKALELDSTCVEVHFALGNINKNFKWNWKSSESEFKKTIELNPGYAEAHATYSNLLIIMGRFDKAIEQGELAYKLDPLNPLCIALYGITLLFSYRYEDAINILREALRMDPNNPLALANLPLALHMLGRYEEEIEPWKTYFKSTFNDFTHVFDQGYARGGYSGALNLEADTLVAQSKTNYINPFEIAVLYACTGNRKRTLDMLENGFEVKDSNMPYINSPVFDFLHNEPRFMELVRKMNLPKINH
jgi:TolB-like protein/lipoprotein NlpI